MQQALITNELCDTPYPEVLALNFGTEKDEIMADVEGDTLDVEDSDTWRKGVEDTTMSDYLNYIIKHLVWYHS